MQIRFPDDYKEIADSMGIALYQRFSVSEASLFLRCQTEMVERLVNEGKIAFIQVTEDEIQFFGFQLLEYLLQNVSQSRTNHRTKDFQERIMRAKEVVEVTGLSRTTIWRMEKAGQFPNRVSLGVGSVGWRESEVERWLDQRTTL